MSSFQGRPALRVPLVVYNPGYIPRAKGEIMKPRMIGVAVLAAMAPVVFAAGSASATTLEVGGVARSLSKRRPPKV
jgi:hypothetical protein